MGGGPHEPLELRGEVGVGVPRCLPVLLHPLGRLGPARVGELVNALAVPLLTPHEALVLEQLQRGVDRAGARPPHAAALLLQAPDELVAVGGAVGQPAEQGGADVAAPHAPPPAPPIAPVRPPFAAGPGRAAVASSHSSVCMHGDLLLYRISVRTLCPDCS